MLYSMNIRKQVNHMTQKLYYEDSHLAQFTARVLSCGQAGERYEVILDRTAFFPGGGGQDPDTGMIGDSRVLGAKERGEDVVHFTDAPVPVGETAVCRLDWMQRFRRMQNHSGEHILSGIIHQRFGYENVGFHMGGDMITVDYSGELTGEQIRDLELACNLAVTENVPVKCWFPDPETLRAMEYRSKKELTGDVRIVTVEGYDTCACCAPHVSRTGEVGIIKLHTFARHRGGTRITMICGLDALDDYNARCANITAISGLLSAKPLETAQAAERMCRENEALKQKLAQANRKLTAVKIAELTEREGNLVLFEPDLDMVCLRELINAAMEKCTGIAAGFTGSDEAGYHYILGSRTVDLRANAKAINAAISGKGGGQKEMIQGTATADEATIRAYFEKG